MIVYVADVTVETESKQHYMTGAYTTRKAALINALQFIADKTDKPIKPEEMSRHNRGHFDNYMASLMMNYHGLTNDAFSIRALEVQEG